MIAQILRQNWNPTNEVDARAHNRDEVHLTKTTSIFNWRTRLNMNEKIAGFTFKVKVWNQQLSFKYKVDRDPKSRST